MASIKEYINKLKAAKSAASATRIHARVRLKVQHVLARSSDPVRRIRALEGMHRVSVALKAKLRVLKRR